MICQTDNATGEVPSILWFYRPYWKPHLNLTIRYACLCLWPYRLTTFQRFKAYDLRVYSQLPLGGGGQKVKNQLFQNMVMLHVKLNEITNAATR